MAPGPLSCNYTHNHNVISLTLSASSPLMPSPRLSALHPCSQDWTKSKWSERLLLSLTPGRLLPALIKVHHSITLQWTEATQLPRKYTSNKRPLLADSDGLQLLIIFIWFFFFCAVTAVALTGFSWWCSKVCCLHVFKAELLIDVIKSHPGLGAQLYFHCFEGAEAPVRQCTDERWINSLICCYCPQARCTGEMSKRREEKSIKKKKQEGVG